MFVAAIIFFLLLSALFSGSEIAFVSANKLRIELKKKKGQGRSAIITRFYDRPAEFLGTMLVGNNIALVVFAALMGKLLTPVIDPIQGDLLSFLVKTLIITIIVLIFGEFLPKTIFRLFADDVLFLLAYPLRALQYLLGAPAWIMTRFSNYILKLFFQLPLEQTEPVFTRLDLEHFINETRTGDKEETIDRELFGKALNLREIRVRECMIPRPEIENIDVKASLLELEQLILETKLSRIIVTDGDIDNVLGYVHHQQLLKPAKNIQSLIMEVPFVPEVTPITKLMNRFIKERQYIACVVDEFGGISGIITLEDILEELFGEIEDEHDLEEHVEKQIDEKEFLFSGRLEIDYLNEKYELLHFPEGDYHTLSGYLVMTTETIPETGAILDMDGYRFVLEMVSDTKIELVRVFVLDQPEK